MTGDRRRAAALQAWAAARGLVFEPRPDPDPAADLPVGRHPGSPSGRSPGRNLVRLTVAGRPALLVDLPGGGWRRAQALAVELPAARAWVCAVPGSGRMPSRGLEVVTGHPAFDQAYRVRAESEAVALRLLEPLATELLDRPRPRLEAGAGRLVLTRTGRCDVAGLDRWLDRWAEPVARLAAVRDG